MSESLALEPALLSLYLSHTGWTRQAESYPGTTSWRHPQVHRKPLLLPIDTDPEAIDHDIIEDAVAYLAAAWSVDPVEVVDRIRSSATDVASVRAVEGLFDLGTMPLGAGVSFFENVRDAFKAASKAERQRRAYFGNALSDVGKRALQTDLQLNQTKVGSYVVQVSSDAVRETATQASRPDGLVAASGRQSKGRDVMLVAAASIKSALAAVVSGGGEAQLWDAVEDGVSSDLCAAIAGLTQVVTGSGSVHVAFSFPH